MRYLNYHKHTHFSNIKSLDVVTKPEMYLERMKELDQTLYFTTEHGYQGSPFETLNSLNEFNKDMPNEKKIKMVVGVEAYFVKDIMVKDRSNYHLVIIALNNSGVEGINKMMSIANKEGHHYKPRVDFKTIKETLNPKDVIVTTACVAGIGALWNEDAENFIKWFSDYFKENFYLEIQSHNHDTQKKHNLRMLEFSRKYNIELIHANDSHYIYPEESVYRDLFLKGKGIMYPEESGFVLDFPTGSEILERYKEQGVVPTELYNKALKNTLIFEEKCEEITLYNTDIKIPKLYDNPNAEFKKILNEEWKKERKKIPKERHKEYIDAIRYETEIVENTYMEEYFLIDKLICDRARDKYDALITKTGRGSAGSFYINKLFGLSGMDRLSSPVTLYPTRFMSISRILETKSLPDIDLNVSDQSALIKASEDILGEEKCGWMVSFKPLQESSAFRLWCKANDYPFEEYNEIAKEIDLYREHEVWGSVIEDSKVFVGVIESISPSPCSMLLSTEDVDSHIGLIKIKDKICCNLDGYNCDKYKYLKND